MISVEGAQLGMVPILAVMCEEMERNTSRGPELGMEQGQHVQSHPICRSLQEAIPSPGT